MHTRKRNKRLFGAVGFGVAGLTWRSGVVGQPADMARFGISFEPHQP